MSGEATARALSPLDLDHPLTAAPDVHDLSDVEVVRRDGERVSFDSERIRVALTKAFLATAPDDETHVRDTVAFLTRRVLVVLGRGRQWRRALHIEEIQDQVELALMREGHHAVARAYVLYREEQARKRAETQSALEAHVRVRGEDGELRPIDESGLRSVLEEACAGLSATRPHELSEEVLRNLYDGVSEDEIAAAGVMAARSLIETEPEYGKVAARLLLRVIRREVLGSVMDPAAADGSDSLRAYFPAYVRRGTAVGQLDPRLLTYDLDVLATALRPERDLQFQYLGLQTLYDRYLLHHESVHFELPQAFFMRVAMGLALEEDDREARAIEFYDLLSSFRFMCSTPTLFNAGTRRPQLSSCFLTTVGDDLAEIYGSIRDNALLSKYAGGLGNDWTPVRALGASIRGTNGESQGIIPFLKVANDTAIAVNQGGKRKGAVCAYLEIWHADVEEFLDLRRNTGDDRRRTHDMHTALWIPDLFMKRVAEGGSWTLFSPDEVPGLHDSYGSEFEALYLRYEAAAAEGEMRIARPVNAEDLWRRALSRLFETGHPWITFKDPCNVRSPQRHAGVVHSSNLCTEITLNSDADEVAVCNLGSINLAAHTTSVGLDREALGRSVRTAVRMLDDVIDLNFYTIPQTRRSNLRHRPVGLGIMGFQDALFTMRMPYASQDAVEFADTSMELVSYLALEASCTLAEERGAYPSFKGSLWSQGVLPIDSVALLAVERGGFLDQDRRETLDWEPLRTRIRQHGLRNSNLMAIAPTATISNICGVSQSIEPNFRNLFVKSNLSGEFTVINPHLVTDLKALDLWDDVMVSDLKHFDGSLREIGRVPEELKVLYATAFEIDCRWLVEAASRRQKWIDQAQSLNLYVASPDGPLLDRIYKLAWVRGLKTTYYLRALGATQVEKSTLRAVDGRLNAVSSALMETASPGASCDLEAGCEVCQ